MLVGSIFKPSVASAITSLKRFNFALQAALILTLEQSQSQKSVGSLLIDVAGRL